MARPHLPTLKVKVAFATDPLATTPTWVDISSYVLTTTGLSITRGRPNESATFSAGQVSMTLNNNDRRFDPSYAAGPYYGNLKPRKMVWIYATWGGVDYTMFIGFVTGWPQLYGKGNKMVTVPLEAVDGLALLAETELPSDMVYSYAHDTIEDLTAFYRQADLTAWVDTEGGTAGFPLNDVSFEDSKCAGSESPSVEFVASTAWVTPIVSGTSLSFWITTTVAGSSTTVWAQVFGLSSSNPGTRIGVDVNGKICGESTDFSPGSFCKARSSIRINDGLTHHVMFVNSSGTPQVFVDGVDVTVMEIASGNAGDAWLVNVIGAPCGSYLATSTEFIGSLQDIAVFSAAVSPTNVLGMFNAGRGYFDETTAERADRVFLAVEWSPTYADITTAPYGVCHAPWRAGDSALGHLQLVANTEASRLFVNKAGEVALQPRYWHQTETRGNTSQATFSSDGADINYQALGTRFDDVDVVTSCTVTADGVGSATSTDATAATAYGLRSRSVSTLLGSIALCQDMADGLVYWWKDPQTRTLPLQVHPGAQTAKWATCLGLEIGDRITVEITPKNVGTQIVLTLLVESLAWDIDGSDWVLTIQGSPVPSSFLVLDTDVLDTGRLGF